MNGNIFENTERGARWGKGIKRYTLLGIKEIRWKDIMYSTGNITSYFIITLNRVYVTKCQITMLYT